MSNQSTDNSKDIVYLFCSASRQLYKQNILDQLAAPVGYVVHYCYDENIVDNNLWKQVYKHNNAFVNRKGYSIFVDQEKLAANTTIKGFYPLREIIIRKTYIDGKVLHVFFEVGEYIPNDNHAIDYYRGPLGNNCPSTIYVSLSSNDIINHPKTNIPEDSLETEWQKLVDQINGLLPFQSSVFFRINKIYLLDPKRINDELDQGGPLALKDILPLSSGFELISGKNYRMVLSFYQPEGFVNNIQWARVIPNLDSSYTAFTPDAVDIGFRYDEYFVDLITKPLTKDALTRIEFKLDQDNEKKLKDNSIRDKAINVNSPQPGFVIRLKALNNQLYIGLGFFLIGNILIGISSLFTPAWKVIVSGIGSAINTLVLFFLYQQLK